MSAWKLSFGRSGVRGLSPRPWGTFLGLRGRKMEAVSGSCPSQPESAATHGHLSPQPWERSPETQSPARSQRNPESSSQGVLSQIFHCDRNLRG